MSNDEAVFKIKQRTIQESLIIKRLLSASETRDAMCTAALFTNTVGMMYCFNEQIHLHKEKRNR